MVSSAFKAPRRRQHGWTGNLILIERVKEDDDDDDDDDGGGGGGGCDSGGAFILCGFTRMLISCSLTDSAVPGNNDHH